MKLSRDDFKKLQQEWYDKLKTLGFKDIEEFHGEELIIKQTASYCYRKDDKFSKEMKEEYYYSLSKFVNDEDTQFRNEIDKTILTLYSEGARIKDIMGALLKIGKSRTKESVRVIIRRYEMIWGLKHYDLKQLRIYK